ncbi:MAG: hypothetical protein PHI88_01525 [Candidatus Pacebacteria bacterium]|nr:hypothetical protein [Candidatus Paceibacterota bacterium]
MRVFEKKSGDEEAVLKNMATILRQLQHDHPERIEKIVRILVPGKKRVRIVLEMLTQNEDDEQTLIQENGEVIENEA